MESKHSVSHLVHPLYQSVPRVLLALVALCLLLPAIAAAQPHFQDVRGELERTDRILERAREQVRISITGRANDLLNQAFSIQNRARRHLYREKPQLRAAFDLTLKARDLAGRAVGTAEIEARAFESTRDLVESTLEMIDRVGGDVRDSGDEQAGRLLQAGIKQLRKAREAYLAGEYRRAIELAALARDLVQRAHHRARDAASGVSNQVETVLDRTDALLDEVALARTGSTDSKAERHYQEARRLQQQAWERHRQGRPRLAVQLASRARQVALDALFLLARDPDREEVERALAVVEQLLTDLSSEILASGSQKAERLLHLARQRHFEAAKQLEEDNLDRAFETARLADRLLRRAAEAAGIE